MTDPVILDNGNIRLYCADCLDILPTLAPGSVDAVIADPPYGIKENAHRVASRGKAAKTIDYGDFDWDSSPATNQEIAAIRAASKQVIIWGGNYFHLPPSRGWLVWDKLNSGNFADCELAWTNLPMSVRIFRHLWNGMIRGSERDCQRVHPTQKPVALMEWCLGWLTGDTVLDPMMGSGSVGMACLRKNRRFIGVEKDARYFAIAVKRIQDELDKREGTGPLMKCQNKLL